MPAKVIPFEFKATIWDFTNECFRRRLILEPAVEEREKQVKQCLFKLITIVPPKTLIGNFRKQSAEGIRLCSVARFRNLCGIFKQWVHTPSIILVTSSTVAREER